MYPAVAMDCLKILPLVIVIGSECIVTGAGEANSQQIQAQFEVASIRRNTSVGDGRMSGGGPQRSGRFTVTNATVWQLFYFAFPFSPELILDAPDWVRRERYDVTAVAPGDRNDWRPAEFLPMVEALLRDRFSLRSHVETRELPVYLLVLARNDRRLGHRLRQESIDCRDPIEAWKELRNRTAGQSRRAGRRRT